MARGAQSWIAVVAVSAFTTGCPEWVPIHNARDFDKSQTIKVRRADDGQDVILGGAITTIATCDTAGFVISKDPSYCREPKLTFDMRRDEAFVYEPNTRLIVTLVVTGILLVIATALIVGFANTPF